MISEPGKERIEGGEERKAGGAKPAGAFSRFKKGLTEGLVIAGVCMTLVGKAGCTYEVPPLDAIPDAGPDVSHTEDAGDRPDSGNDGGVQEEDAGHDGGAGGHDGGEGGMDAGHDGGSGGMDAGLDGGEGGMDAGLDGGEGGMDAGLDAGVDSGTDAGVDSGTPDAGIVCGSVTTGTFNGFISLASPAHVGNYTFSYHGIDGSGDALVSISCTEGEFETSLPCALNVNTVVSRPSDGAVPGRTITIHPTAASASNSTLSISVTSP